MKKFILLAVSFMSITANAGSTFECVDGSRSFEITKKGLNAYRGSFRNFDGSTQAFRCSRSGSAPQFTCSNKSYVAKTLKTPEGRTMVQFEIEGDFYPDSGYLFSLYCER